ncbi:MAG: response regulator [Thermodesulfovibrionales bacterium]|jgi:diguanylate cyclase (GGDEF)-like protein
MLKIALAGGNITGSTVLSMLRNEPDIKIVGLYEKNPETPGAALARKWGIPIFDDINILATSSEPEIIFNVTGEATLSETIRVLFNHIEVIDTIGARFLWKTIEKQKKAMVELYKAIEDEKRIGIITENMARVDQLGEFLRFVLEKALEITDSPAGSIALVEKGEMHVLASKGLSKRFTDNERWKIMTGGLTDLIIKKKEMVAIPDLSKVNYTNNAVLMDEGIASVLVSPLLINSHVFGVLYLDDFKPRQYSERQKRAVSLFSRILGLIVDRQNTLKKIREQEGAIAELTERIDKTVMERTEDLEKLNRELDRESQLKSRFITNMNHELRTPLNSILGFSDVLLEKTFGDLTENQERYIKNIQSSGKHLLDIINNCLDIAKIEAGKFDMSYETFPVISVLSEVFNIMTPLADKKTIEFKLSMSDSVDSITADRVKLKQILYNLLSNAVKFTPEGGKVGVLIDREPGKGESGDHQYVKFSVWDTGVGLSPDDKERIFNEFEQVESTLSRRYEGVGLGLALTKRLVELHTGRISVESKLGEGSTFTFEIPITSPVQESPSEEVEAVNLNFPWMEERAPLILVVEDDAPSAELLTLHLTQAGYKVAHAFDGEDAIEKANILRPFAILLDIMLPKKDGWEVLQALKGDEATARIPVLIHSIIDNKDLAFALGATDYLLKPLDKDALLNILQGLSIMGCKRCPVTILVIEAKGDLDSLLEGTTTQEFLVYSAKEGRRGIELATALRPDVILLDFELPDMLGFDAVKELKENPSTRNIPIFILTERDISVEDRISVVGKIERIIRKHKFNPTELLDHIMEIEVLYPKKAGLLDGLTGIFSHRYFQIRLAQEVEKAMRYKQPLDLIILDVDSFGTYVSSNGDQFGNEVLVKIAELLRKNIRGSDVVVRYGRDAFAVLLPNTVLSSALSLGNRFAAIIRNYPFVHGETQPKGRVTASVGLAFLDGQTPEELILCCERALSHAIKRGGDRVEIYSKEMDEAEAFPQT